jgi:hypothetical protein
MGKLDDARSAWETAYKSGDFAKMAQASDAWRSVADAEKAEVETAQLKKPAASEQSKFWVPVVTAAALVGTLVFQVISFRQNAQAQRAADEDSAYRAS